MIHAPVTRPLNQKGYGLIGGLVSLFFGVILAIVAFRFVFRLLGANPDNAIVSWIYAASQPLVAPFFGIFNLDMNLLTGRFEAATLVALVVYGVIASLITRLFAGGSRRAHSL
jgi:uncharacterized protein YggT (Ycf19 family)